MSEPTGYIVNEMEVGDLNTRLNAAKEMLRLFENDDSLVDDDGDHWTPAKIMALWFELAEDYSQVATEARMALKDSFLAEVDAGLIDLSKIKSKMYGTVRVQASDKSYYDPEKLRKAEPRVLMAPGVVSTVSKDAIVDLVKAGKLTSAAAKDALCPKYSVAVYGTKELKLSP
jgi:hypothetical protein